MPTRGAFVRSARAPAQFFGLRSPGPVAKRLPRNKGKLFEQEYTRAKHQRGPIRLAPTQKGY